MSDEDDDDKQYAPSQKRLDDARARGEIPKSTDLNTAASYAGLLVVATFAGAKLLQNIGNSAMIVLDQADRLAPLLFAAAPAPSIGLSQTILLSASPIVLFPMAFVIASLLAQRALHFAPEKLMPKASRISPMSIAKQKFGREGLFEFAKSFAKLIVVAVLLGVVLHDKAPEILATQSLMPMQIVSVMLDLMLQLLLLVAVAIAGFGAIDFIWQKSQHIRRNMMSRKEMMDEMKDAEGDPHVKQQRRQRGQEIATNQMLQDVASADVVLVNPTHYAVALKWNRSQRKAPICVAKGTDEIAARIREKAAESGVPIFPDPPTTRAIYAAVELGQQIHQEHFRAVAAAIRFSEKMRRKK